MAQIKAWGRRIGGIERRWNVADDIPGRDGDPKTLTPEAEQAFLEDEITYHRDQMKLSALRLQIAGARAVHSQAIA